jgi:hypothetical protein
MGSIKLTSRLPQVAAAIPREEEQAISEFSQELVDTLKGAVWKRWGYVGASVKDHSLDPYRADIWIGAVGAIGFYSGFQELGTKNQAARPVVAPTAHMMEPRLVVIVSEHLRQAARAG